MYRAPVRPLGVVLLLVSGSSLLGCESTSSPVPVYLRDVTPQMVTGAALAALGTDGRFHVAPPSTSPGQLSATEATSQSLQYARYVTNNIFLRGTVEDGRGGYWTDPHLLTACPDPLHYVRSQLGAIPSDTIPADVRQSFLQSFGPQWLIALCGSANDPQMVVQAAIEENSVRFANGEPVEEYPTTTTAWFPRGVPLNWPDALPISRERAARFAFETFGVRVSEVPDLMFRGDVLSDNRYQWFQIGSARNCNRWRVVLESGVTIRGQSSLRTQTTDTVFVGALSCSRDVIPQIHLPLAEQPTTVLLSYLRDGLTWVVRVPVVSPIRFEIGSRSP